MNALFDRRRLTPLVALGLSGVVLTGCGFEGAASIPLPGGEGNGDDAYAFHVEFTDVLDLVPQSAVKVDDVTVGSVSDIELDGYTALVTVSVNGDVELPANTSASLRQTSLLGEKFVSLDPPPPAEAADRPLRSGDLISLEDTTRSAEIEEVLGALSLVLNGGSLEQLQVINTEIVNALEGREPEVKSALNELEEFVGGLEAQKGQIVRALDSLDRLTSTLVTERQTIATALEDIPAGVEVLDAQREDLVAMLTALEDLGDVAVRVINKTQANTVADLRALQPILAQLNAAGEDLPNSLELLTTYPFPRNVFHGIRGDYANLFVTMDLSTALENEGVPDPTGELPELPIPDLPIPDLPGVPPLPDLPPPPVTDQPVPTPSGPGAEVPEIPAPAPLPTQRGLRVPDLPASLNPFSSSSSSTGLMQLLLGGLS
jgi:phospholipid/cholesterol/gamma-HCH transport system substrate-binding protein